jgi:hypothetical protein
MEHVMLDSLSMKLREGILEPRSCLFVDESHHIPGQQPRSDEQATSVGGVALGLEQVETQ